jgi:hypothetical protein
MRMRPNTEQFSIIITLWQLLSHSNSRECVYVSLWNNCYLLESIMTFHHEGPFHNLWIMAYKTMMHNISLFLTFFMHMHQSEKSNLIQINKTSILYYSMILIEFLVITRTRFLLCTCIWSNTYHIDQNHKTTHCTTP